jgi:uncharacterized membrane protein
LTFDVRPYKQIVSPVSTNQSKLTSTLTRNPRELERIIQWVIVGIVLVVGLSILGFLLDIAVGSLWFGAKVLIILFLVMAVIRFLQYLSGGSGSRP